jgi:hypothetical protein
MKLLRYSFTQSVMTTVSVPKEIDINLEYVTHIEYIKDQNNAIKSAVIHLVDGNSFTLHDKERAETLYELLKPHQVANPS